MPPKQQQFSEDACRVCGKEDDEEFLVLCDGCDKPFHTMCHLGCVCCNLKPKNSFNRKPAVPEGDWFCKFCAGHLPALADGAKPMSSVFAWGDNEDGQLALSGKTDAKAVWTPTKVHDLDGIGVLKIACCETATIILANDANLYSAGTGGVGQLGHQDMVHEKLTKFRKIEAMTEDKRSKGEGRFNQLVAGRDFVAAITTQGHVYTWGNGEFGQLGHQENKVKKVPKKISALREMELPIEHAACGFDFMLFTSKESDDDSQFNTQKPGVFMSMGSNAQGQLGDGTGKNQWVPQLLNKDGPSRTSSANAEIDDPQEFLLGRDLLILVAGKSHAAAVAANTKSLWTWGYGEMGQLGHPKPAPQAGQSKFFRSQFRVPRPRFVQALKNETVVQVACGGQHTLVLLQDGRLFGMGDNTYGQLGVKVPITEPKAIESPVHIPQFGSGKLTQIACGDEYSVALTGSGEVFSWGRGQYGQLGLGEKQVGPLDTPTKIPDLPKIKKVFTGPNQVFAIEFTDETLPPPFHAPVVKRGPPAKGKPAATTKKARNAPSRPHSSIGFERAAFASFSERSAIGVIDHVASDKRPGEMNQQQFATYNHPSTQQQMFAAAHTNSGYGQAGQFASVGRTASISLTGSGGGAMMMNGASLSSLPPIYAWMPPSPQEHQYYDVLFSVADEEQRNAIGGRLAVMFFSRSNADKQILREIWNIADSQQKGELSRNEFYVAMRLISMAQRGEPISVQRFYELAPTPYPLPALEGVPPPPQLPQQQMPSMPMGAGGAANGAQARGSGYAVTDEEKTRYDAIFAQYDADNDGFLLGGEAVNLFQMSGLDRNALRDIWALADRGQDSKLDVKEFYVAMHLIVCASKRGLPVPAQLPQELIDSAFGAARGSFTSATGSSSGSMSKMQSDFAGAAAVGGGAPSPSPAQDSSADSDDPFAGLTSAADAQAPRLGSFTAAQPQPTTPMSDRQGSFHGASGNVQQQPTPPGSARGSFYGASVPATPTADIHGSVSGGFERTNSSSMDNFSSGVHMTMAPSVPTYETPGGVGGVGINHHPGGAAHNGMMMGGYGGAPQAHMMAAPPAKPFLSDEEEVQAVRQLEQQNDDVAKALSSIEKKQKSIETLAEKLRELDQLRHDLVALAMKRESVRAANNAAASSSSSSSAGDNSAELQTKRVVEKSLQDLIDSEKQTVEKLQRDLSGLEAELQNSLSSSMTNISLNAPASSSSSAPAPSSFNAFPAAGFGSFDDFGANPGSNASTPASAVAFDFPTSSPANSTSSSTFDSFGDFGAKPSPSPMTAVAPTAAPSSSFDAFAGFDFNIGHFFPLARRQKVNMVSAAEALRTALHEGVLEKKKRTGGWTKKQFVLTPARWLYFDSVESTDARNSLATNEILKVQRNEQDPTQKSFFLVFYKKRKEYRALDVDDRDAWIQALESVAALKNDANSENGGNNRNGLPFSAGPSVFMDSEKESLSSHDSGSATTLLGPNGIDLTRLCEQMKKAFSWQIQISKSFTAKDVVEFIKKQVPDIAHVKVLQIGQDLIDSKLIVPLKSHVFDENDPGRFKFYEAATQKQPRNHLAMRAQSISDLMGTSSFNARKYAEDFLKKHSSEKIDVHCKKLVVQKEQTIEELKEEISANYTSFIQATTEIKRMENSVSQLKTLVLDCKRSIQCLKSVSLDISAVKKETPGYEVAEKRAAERAKSTALDQFIHDLEVFLHERDYEAFSRLLLEHKQKQDKSKSGDSSSSASDQQQQQIDQLQQQFVGRLVEEFNSSMQTSERMHKKEDHLKFLIQLGEAQLATEMCLQNYSVRIALQLRHVPSYGNALNYVINLSRTFFTSLLVCYEDYEESFRGQKSAHFISLTVWISAQLERFASEIICHIFPNDLRARSSTSSGSSSSNCVAIDVPEFKNVTKYVSSALRYVFYGSRQLELAGLPTAHCLAPHLVKGLVPFLGSYGSSIKGTMKEEIKRERWEAVKRTIRDTESKRDREISLTQSARSFYSMVQQFLRDVQRVLNPSCATSYLSEVHEAVVLEADELLIQYTVEVQKYLESPKMSSSLRFKQVVAILTNVAYIHDDCTARSTHILEEYLPKAALQNRDVDVENARLWKQVVEVGVKRCAQSILKMSIRWQELDLSEEPLPDVGQAKANAITSSSSNGGGSGLKSSAMKTIFVETLLKELDGASNDQLEKALRKYRKRCLQDDAAQRAEDKGESEYDGADDDNEDQMFLATMVLEAMLRKIQDDETWWQLLRKSDGKGDRRIGYGGVNKFIAELRVVSQSVQASKAVEELCDAVISKMMEVYLQFHPEKKGSKDGVQAGNDWLQAYMAVCTLPQQEEPSTS